MSHTREAPPSSPPPHAWLCHTVLTTCTTSTARLKRYLCPLQDLPLSSRLAELVSSLCGLLYYPFEHAAWLADNNILPNKSTTFWTIAIVLWGVPLVISALQSVLALININREMELAWKQAIATSDSHLLDRREYSGVNPQMCTLMTRRFHIILSLVRSLCDLMNAVHWLPEGFLWSGKLPIFWVGVFGTISSLIGLYKIMPSKAI